MEGVTASVLRNRGAPVHLARLAPDGSPLFDADGNAQTEEVWIRFNANHIAEIEDRYGGEKRTVTNQGPDGPVETEFFVDPSQVLGEALQAKPKLTVRYLLSLALGQAVETVGERMLTEYDDEYATAVGVAHAIAMGIDPLTVEKMYQAGMEMYGLQVKARNELVLALVESATTDGSPGPTGLPTGPALDGHSKSSGDSGPAR